MRSLFPLLPWSSGILISWLISFSSWVAKIVLTSDWIRNHTPARASMLHALGCNQPITCSKPLQDRQNRSRDQLGWFRARPSPQKPGNNSREDLLGRCMLMVVLGLARLHRTPMNLVERCNKQLEGWNRANLVNRCKKDDWVLDPSIGYDPLLYIDGVVSVLSRKQALK
jgi:hypothetical protein